MEFVTLAFEGVGSGRGEWGKVLRFRFLSNPLFPLVMDVE